MINARIIPALIAFCVIPFLLSGQKFQNLNDRFPMGLSEVIYQDSYGFLWIGTVDGLVRYDGYNTVHYYSDQLDSFAISGNNLNAISEDNTGHIWLGLSVDGANIFDRNSGKFNPICFVDQDGNCIDEISINDFVQDGDFMWAATNLGLFTIKTSGSLKSIDHYKFNNTDSTSLSGSYIHRVFIDKQNTLWVATQDGINKFDRETQQFTNYRTNKSFPMGQILDISEGPDSTLWISPRFAEYGLYTWNPQKREFLPELDFPRSLGELQITWDLQKNMWISSRGVGAFRIDALTGDRTFFDPINSDFHGYRNLYGLSNLTDSYGNVWIVGGNVLKWPASGKSIQNISSNSNLTISVFADENYIWFCAKEPLMWNKHTLQLEKFWTTEYPTNLRRIFDTPLNIVRIYHYDDLDEDHLIFATTRNIYIWNKRNNTFQEYASNAGGPFRDFVFDRKSNVLWICPNQGTPARFNVTTRTFDRPEVLRPVRGAHSVEMGVDGDIWFGSERYGLYRYNEGTNEITTYTPHHENPGRRISGTKVNDLYMDHENNLWVATSRGVNMLAPDSDTVVTFNHQTNLPNFHVTSILEDSDQNIWLGTYNGLASYSKSTGEFRHFNQTNGLINANYLPRSAYTDSKGILYFGGDKGIDFFNPLLMGVNPIPPDVYLSNVSVNNAPVKTDLAPENIKLLEFDYREKIIEIELLALHLTAPLANIYSYRISNINEEWIDLGTRRTITLANPSPGDYHIEVKAANSDGIWSTPKKLISLKIYPPYWKTPWFITLTAFLALGLLFALYQYRTRQVRKEERLKADFGKQIAELELKALRAQMNPHFLFNSLNSIKSLISAGESAKATEYVTRFSQLIRQVLSNSEQSLVRLQEDLEALRLYLEIERLRFQNFEFSIEVAEDVNTDFVEVPPLLLQPYVENAIWHGLMHLTDDHKKVDISVQRDGDYLIMKVEDNGIGREKARQIKMRGGPRKGGMGMRITSDRIKLLRDFYGQDATVIVEDLLTTTDNGTSHGAGTRVTVRIPVPD